MVSLMEMCIRDSYQLVKELAAAGKKPDLYTGFRDEPYGLERFTSLCGRVHVATDSGKVGYHGLVTGILHPEEYDLVPVSYTHLRCLPPAGSGPRPSSR